MLMGVQYMETHALGQTTERMTRPRGAGFMVEQNLFNGFRTRSTVRHAESNVMDSRATLRNPQQDTLLDPVTAYMDAVRDAALLNLERNNVKVFGEQLRQIHDHSNIGKVTRTDVTQAKAAVAHSQARTSQA